MQTTPSKPLCSLGGTTISTNCHTTPRKSSFEDCQCTDWLAQFSPKRILPASPSDSYYDRLKQAPRKGVSSASDFTDSDRSVLRRRLFQETDDDQMNSTQPEISLAEFKLISDQPDDADFVVGATATEDYATRLFQSLRIDLTENKSSMKKQNERSNDGSISKIRRLALSMKSIQLWTTRCYTFCLS